MSYAVILNPQEEYLSEELSEMKETKEKLDEKKKNEENKIMEIDPLDPTKKVSLRSGFIV